MIARLASRARNALIVVQVTASALLLICAGVFLRSALRSSTVDPGLRTADNIIIDINNEPFRPAMVAAVTAEPSVAAVAASWPDPLGRPRAAFGWSASAEATADKSAASGRLRFVSPEYFSVLDIGVLRGREFTQAEPARTPPSPWCPKPLRGRSGRRRRRRSGAAARAGSEFGNSPRRTSPPAVRRPSSSSASFATWPAFESPDTRKRACTFRPARKRREASSRASTAIQSLPVARYSNASRPSIRTWGW